MAKKRLLVIEDDVDVAEMLTVYFSGQGYDVIHALTGADGVSFARAKFPNLILLDVMLPDMDGFEVCRILRHTTLTKYVPITFLTQRDGRSDKVAGLELGADDYVTKPFDIEELRIRIQNSLRRSSRELLHDPHTGLPAGTLVEDMRHEIAGQPGWTMLDIHLTGLADFRDQYSFLAADEALALTAQTIIGTVNQVGTPSDFVGTTGENQFVWFTRATDINTLHQTLTTGFDHSIRSLYNFIDSDRGYLLIQNWDNSQRRAPLMKLVVRLPELENPI
jgi:DNA-binding response OmpR family regulator